MNSTSETPHTMDVNKLNLSENDWLKVLTNLSSSSMSSLQETLKRLQDGTLQMQTDNVNKLINAAQTVALTPNPPAGVVVSSPKPVTSTPVGVPMTLNPAAAGTPIMGNTISLPASMLNQVSNLQSTNILGSTNLGAAPGGTQTIVLALTSPTHQNAMAAPQPNKAIKQLTNFGPRCVTVNHVLTAAAGANNSFPAQGMLTTSNIVNANANNPALTPVLNNLALNAGLTSPPNLPKQEVPAQLNLTVTSSEPSKANNETSSSLYALATAAVEAFKEVDIVSFVS